MTSRSGKGTVVAKSSCSALKDKYDAQVNDVQRKYDYANKHLIATAERMNGLQDYIAQLMRDKEQTKRTHDAEIAEYKRAIRRLEDALDTARGNTSAMVTARDNTSAMVDERASEEIRRWIIEHVSVP